MRSLLGRLTWTLAVLPIILVAVVPAPARAQASPRVAANPVLQCQADRFLWSCAGPDRQQLVYCNAFFQCSIRLAHGGYGFSVTPVFGALVRTAIREPALSQETPASLLEL